MRISVPMMYPYFFGRMSYFIPKRADYSRDYSMNDTCYTALGIVCQRLLLLIIAQHVGMMLAIELEMVHHRLSANGRPKGPHPSTTPPPLSGVGFWERRQRDSSS